MVSHFYVAPHQTEHVSTIATHANVQAAENQTTTEPNNRDHMHRLKCETQAECTSVGAYNVVARSSCMRCMLLMHVNVMMDVHADQDQLLQPLAGRVCRRDEHLRRWKAAYRIECKWLSTPHDLKSLARRGFNELVGVVELFDDGDM